MLNCTAEQKEYLKDEFQMLEDFIYETMSESTCVSKQQYKKKDGKNRDYAYLDGLSQEARNLVEQGEVNLYHSAMAVIDNMTKKKIQPKEDIKEHYLGLSKKKKHVEGKMDLVEEIFELCWERYKSKHKEKFR